MQNVKMILEYEGTHYHGFQRQPNGISIQEVLESKLLELTQESIKINSSGRTDAGVHAKAQVINFKTSTTIPVNRLGLALNTLLPEDIVVKGVELVPDRFHARYSAKSKVYCYNIWNSIYPPVFLRNFIYFLPPLLSLELMREGGKYLMGEHDFSAYCSKRTGVKTYLREIFSLEIRQREENLVEIEIEANGFLYNMVRIIVGTLIQVGLGKIRPQDVERILLSRDRRLAGNTTPAKGLYLKEVKY